MRIDAPAKVLLIQADKRVALFRIGTNPVLENVATKISSPFRFLMRSNIPFVPDSKRM